MVITQLNKISSASKISAIIKHCLMLVHIDKVVWAKMSAKATDYVLALATLDYATQIGSFLFVWHHPRWPRQVQW